MLRRSIYFLLASVALLHFAVRAQNDQTPTLTVEISDRVPRVGDEVTFTCIVTALSGNTLTLNKVIVRPEGKMTSEQISINDVLGKLYKNLQRFTVTKTTDGSSQRLSLRIAGVQFEDSGHYGCSAPEIDNLYNMEILEVYRKPENVTLAGFATTSNAVAVVQEDEKADITCLVPNVLPIPSIQLWLERSMIGPADIVDLFVLSSELNILCPENPLEKTCPLHMSYNVAATNRQFIPTFLHDGKQLTCTAKMKQHSGDEMSSTVTLDVRYPPKFFCAGLWNGTVNMTDLRIVCQVYANPPSSRSNKSVTVKEVGRMVVMHPGDESPDYSLEDKPMASTDLKVTSLEFVIKTVTEEHFSYVYYLFAINEAGNTTKEIRIAQTMTPLWDGADGLRGTINLSAIILFIFFALAFNHL